MRTLPNERSLPRRGVDLVAMEDFRQRLGPRRVDLEFGQGLSQGEDGHFLPAMSSVLACEPALEPK